MSKQAKPSRKFIQEFDHTGRHRVVVVDSIKGSRTSPWAAAGSWSKIEDFGLWSVPEGNPLIPAGLYRLLPVAHDKLKG